MLEDIVRSAIVRLFEGRDFCYSVEDNLREAMFNSDEFIEAVMARVDSLYGDVIESVVRDIENGDYDEIIESEVLYK